MDRTPITEPYEHACGCSWVAHVEGRCQNDAKISKNDIGIDARTVLLCPDVMHEAFLREACG